jgi:bifunctional non-homologous end joining protein LigD
VVAVPNLRKPSFVSPMLPSLVLETPDGEDWIHEIKFDGYRTMLAVERGEARAFTRNGHDWTDSYAPIVAEAAKLRCQSAIIDGEVVASAGAGEAAFDGIRPAIARGGRGLVMVAFDLLFLDGKDLRSLPLAERRRQLQRLLPKSTKALLQFSQAIAGDGSAVFAEADRMGLEGIVSKRLDSRYRSGRSDQWRKIKAWTESRFVLVGTELDSRSGAPIAILAREDEVPCAMRAALSSPSRDRFVSASGRASNGFRPIARRLQH